MNASCFEYMNPAKMSFIIGSCLHTTVRVIRHVIGRTIMVHTTSMGQNGRVLATEASKRLVSMRRACGIGSFSSCRSFSSSASSWSSSWPSSEEAAFVFARLLQKESSLGNLMDFESFCHATEFLELDLSEIEMKRIFSQMDVNSDGLISLSEFQSASTSSPFLRTLVQAVKREYEESNSLGNNDGPSNRSLDREDANQPVDDVESCGNGGGSKSRSRRILKASRSLKLFQIPRGYDFTKSTEENYGVSIDPNHPSLLRENTTSPAPVNSSPTSHSTTSSSSVTSSTSSSSKSSGTTSSSSGTSISSSPTSSGSTSSGTSSSSSGTTISVTSISTSSLKDTNTPLFYGDFIEIRKTLDYSYHKNYSKERQLWQDKLIQRTLLLSGAPKERPWLVYTCGPMGAGKGFVLGWMSAKGILPLEEVSKIDPDHYKVNFPEWPHYLLRDQKYFRDQQDEINIVGSIERSRELMRDFDIEFQNLKAAGTMTHKESGYIAEIAQMVGMQTGQNVWVDGSLRNSDYHTRKFEYIRRNFPHYRIAILAITASDDVILKRITNRNRGISESTIAADGISESQITEGKTKSSKKRNTSRYVSPELALTASRAIQVSVPKLTKLVDFFARINNNDDTEPVLEYVEMLNTKGDWDLIKRLSL